MAKMLTDAAVKKYRPTGKRRVIRDAGARSLYLVVEASGHKSWMMRFRRPGGKAGKMVLGPLHAEAEPPGEVMIGMPLTLTGARQLAAQVHRDRARGADVVADHKARRHRQQSIASGTYCAAAKAFVEEHAKVKTRRWKATARSLGIDPETLEPIAGGLAERWGDRDVRTLNDYDIYTVLDEARRVSVPGIKARTGASESRARAFGAILSALFGWCKRHRRVDANPAAGVWRPPPAPARERVLTDGEVVKLWQAACAVGSPHGAVLRLLLLTGSRLNEIAGLRWDEISEDRAEIRLPGTRTKNHRAHVVPLAPMAREIIELVPRIDGSQHVFTTNGSVPVAIGSKVKRKLDALMGIAKWTIHDIRRTAVTGMAELGIPPHVIELIVNHVSGSRGGVAGIYNRSEMMLERRDALERWALHLAGVVAGKAANVVAYAPGRKRRVRT
jgi:integrase